MLLEGLHIPLTTPFHPDGRLNLPKLAANVARTSKSAAAGLLVLGPQGEPTMLTDEETRDVLRAAAQAATPEKVLLAGVSRDSVRATLALTEFAAELFYDVVLVGMPSMFTRGNKTESIINIEELIFYLKTVADRSSLPVLLYNDREGRIPLDAIVELAAHPRVLGLLDAAAGPAEIEAILQRTAAIQREVAVTPVFQAVTARMKKAAQSHAPSSLISAASLGASANADAEAPTPPLRTRTKTIGFQILSAHASRLLDALSAGAVGIAPAFAAAAPQACYEVLAAWREGDQPLAEEKQARLRAAARLAEAGPGNLKYACDLNGYFGGQPRMPHLPPTGSQRATLEQMMKPLRN
jgi:dihydrodipicolinate synthase/N-acetylneuraminate lyase